MITKLMSNGEAVGYRVSAFGREFDVDIPGLNSDDVASVYVRPDGSYQLCADDSVQKFHDGSAEHELARILGGKYEGVRVSQNLNRYEDLKHRRAINGVVIDHFLVLSGLPMTGKTVSMYHIAQDLMYKSGVSSDRICLLKLTSFCSLSVSKFKLVLDVLSEFADYIMIDNVDYFSGYNGFKKYPEKCKFVLSGENICAMRFLAERTLHCQMIQLSYIPYREYKTLIERARSREYIESCGVFRQSLSLSHSDYVKFGYDYTIGVVNHLYDSILTEFSLKYLYDLSMRVSESDFKDLMLKWLVNYSVQYVVNGYYRLDVEDVDLFEHEMLVLMDMNGLVDLKAKCFRPLVLSLIGFEICYKTPSYRREVENQIFMCFIVMELSGLELNTLVTDFDFMYRNGFYIAVYDDKVDKRKLYRMLSQYNMDNYAPETLNIIYLGRTGTMLCSQYEIGRSMLMPTLDLELASTSMREVRLLNVDEFLERERKLQ